MGHADHLIDPFVSPVCGCWQRSVNGRRAGVRDSELADSYGGPSNGRNFQKHLAPTRVLGNAARYKTAARNLSPGKITHERFRLCLFRVPRPTHRRAVDAHVGTRAPPWSRLRRYAIQPVPGASLRVGHGQHPDFRAEVDEDDRVRKARDERTPDTEVLRQIEQARKRGRGPLDDEEDALHLVQEVQLESGTPGSVPIGSLGQLGDRLREEADHAHRGRNRL